MKLTGIILALLMVFSCGLAYGEEPEVENTIDPVMSQMETLRASSNETTDALMIQFQNGEITKQEFVDGIIAENTALTALLAPLRTQLPDELKTS